MVHTFNIEKKYFLYDVESGSLHLCDKLSFFIVENMNGGNCALDKFSKIKIEESKSDINKLIQDGVLFSKAPDFDFKSSNTPDIKALCLHISHDCNLKCGYCFAGGGNYNAVKGLMSSETAKASIDFLIKHSGSRHNLEVDFFGGEPLLNFETVKQTVYYAKEQARKQGKSFKFTLTTNAILLNDEITDFLNDEMDNVVISIDGRTKIHNAMRRTLNNKNSFKIVLEKAKDFKANRKDKNYYVRGTYTSLNTDFSKDVLFLNDCGFDQISLEPVVLEENNPLAIKPCHIEKIKSEYEVLARKYIKRRKGKKWFNFFHFMIDLKGGPCLKRRFTGCGAGNEYLAVSPDGAVYPCHRFVGDKKYKIGNVLNNEINNDIRNIFAKSDLLTKQECLSCFAKYNCGGGCAANNIFLSGKIDNPYKPSCEIMKKRLECSLYIYAVENMRK